MFICGSGSFGHDDHQLETQFNNTHKRARRSTSFCKIMGRDNANKNPFADRGLDKFYALLADLDDKKQKIYTQKGSEDISFVRFVYTNDDPDKVRPIVVKVKDKTLPEKNVKNLIEQRSFKSINKADASDKISPPTLDAPKEETIENGQRRRKRRWLVRCNGSFKLEDLRRPQYYFAAMVVMVLLFLAIYGRSFAILCTSVGWYLAPTSPSSLPSERKPKRKNPSDRKVARSEGPSSPTSIVN